MCVGINSYSCSWRKVSQLKLPLDFHYIIYKLIPHIINNILHLSSFDEKKTHRWWKWEKKKRKSHNNINQVNRVSFSSTTLARFLLFNFLSCWCADLYADLYAIRGDISIQYKRVWKEKEVYFCINLYEGKCICVVKASLRALSDGFRWMDWKIYRSQ